MLYFYCMKKKIFLTFTALSVLFTFILSSCAGTPETEQEEPQAPVEIQDEIETVETEPVEVVSEEDDSVIVIDDEDESDDEYLRSIAALDAQEAVSKQEFADDKREILELISELAIIMETKDTLNWLGYIEDESKDYWKNPANLRKAQRKLPNKLIELKTIEDYFKYVWIPARQNKQIDEIHYISKTNVKAVQIREDLSELIYYEFIKINGKWLLYLPPVS